MAGVPAVAHRRRWIAAAGIGCGVRPGIRWPVSYGRPRCRAKATYAHDPGHGQRPDGRRRRKSVPDCVASSREARSSQADRIRAGKKTSCCVTTRGRNARALNGLGRRLGALTARLLGPGVLGFDRRILATIRLAARRLPATELALTLRVLAVTLVPAPRLVLACASFAQADPPAWSAPSGRTVVLCFTVRGAHGSGNSQGKCSGRVCKHSPRALSKREQDPLSPVYRRLANQTANQTLSSLRSEPDAHGSAAVRTIVFPRTTPRDKWSHRRAGNKDPQRCPSNDHRLENKTMRQTVSSTRWEQDTGALPFA